MNTNRKRIVELVGKSIRRYKVFFWIGIITGIVMGPGVILAYFMPGLASTVPQEQKPYMLVIGIVFSVLFPVVLFEQSRNTQKTQRLINVVRGLSGEIVWLYKLVSTGGVGATPASSAQVASFSFAVVGLLDGSILTIGLPEHEVEELLSKFHTEFPEAAVGYSKDWERLFKKDPSKFYHENSGKKKDSDKDLSVQNVA
ncbi:hypothetical protein GF357_04300 [Candidatus Dojkabacteria bacterium]|nr:hypothetical protein [Candidatus Dojkabacteria bacterium]